MLNDKAKDNIDRYRVGIVAFLIIVLITISVYTGAMISCKDGYLRGLSCVETKKVATVSVCEYNPINCASKCTNFLVDDVKAFCDEYATGTTEFN